jgi:hypothetical protein
MTGFLGTKGTTGTFNLKVFSVLITNKNIYEKSIITER